VRPSTRLYVGAEMTPPCFDEMILFEHGRKLFAAARAPKTFFELTGDHNEGEALTAPAYRQALDAFLTGQLGLFRY